MAFYSILLLRAFVTCRRGFPKYIVTSVFHSAVFCSPGISTVPRYAWPLTLSVELFTFPEISIPLQLVVVSSDLPIAAECYIERSLQRRSDLDRVWASLVLDKRGSQ